VCLCVTRRYCIKTAKGRITQTAPRDGPGTLVFGCQNLLVDDIPTSPWNLRSKWAPRFTTAQFKPIFAYSVSNVRAGEKEVELTLIGSRSRAFHGAINEPGTLPLSPVPQMVAQNAILLFPVNFNFCWKTSATKFLCVKTSSTKVVATSFLYLTIHRLIALDVPIYQKLRSKWPTLSENADFDRFR